MKQTNKNKKERIDIIIPSYNEAGNIKILIDRIKNSIPTKYKFNIIFIDDGSTDDTLNEIINASKKFNFIRYISFSRNFGHQIALKAGIDFSNADCAISLDADLQHPPELIPEMISKWIEGYNIVYTKRLESKNISFFKSITAIFFYKILNYLSGLEINQGAADFRLLDRKVVLALQRFQEKNLFIRGMVTGIGFKKFCISYQPEKRVWGKSKYSFKKMFLFALDGITSFSVKPLHLATIAGIFISFCSGIYGLYAVTIFFTSNQVVSGWTSVLLTVLFMGGIQLIILGILGEYIGKMFLQSKNRPNYLIQETNCEQSNR
jgi:glycosyltransferase involved in cell wall biosynthesis